ncbi:MAG: tyrosine-type recombinase/integrase, partial [Phycisphaerales bacterium]|nr:tyrosine-type recombinase/integrase [Phycisphaerales bacterium]
FFADRPDDAYLFSPSEAESERRAALTAKRKTPLSYGNRTGTNRIPNPEKQAGDRYTTPSYYSAIQRACDRASPPPPPLCKRDDETIAQWNARLNKKQKEQLKDWRAPFRWHPHQLRHNAATDIRKAFGLEAAQLALGHASAQITDAIYAERDHSKVIEVMQRVG